MIKVFYTMTGQIIGEFDWGLSGQLVVKNPCIVHVTHEQVMMQPLLAGIVDENTLEIIKDSLAVRSQDSSCGFTPSRELYNLYNKTFGSGLQLPT